MSDNTMIASAVVVPDSQDIAIPPNPSLPSSPSLKRRQLSPSPDSSKRPRLLDTRNSSSRYGNEDDQRSPPSATSPPPPAPLSPQSRRKSSTLNSSGGGGGAAEERKRGQRLFGALLGTLSQSTSSSPAHRRRSEIEKKQLGKLRQREEEVAEEKKKKREELDLLRRKEQKLWDEQGMRIRHRNMQAIAQFLKTKAQPPLYYKPWDLRPEEEEQIKRQIEETDLEIHRELAEHSSETRQANNHTTRKQNEVHFPRVSSTNRASSRTGNVEPDSSKTIRKVAEEAEEGIHIDGGDNEAKKTEPEHMGGSEKILTASQTAAKLKEDDYDDDHRQKTTNNNTDNDGSPTTNNFEALEPPATDADMGRDHDEKPEEKVQHHPHHHHHHHDDHGGDEELVEGQEDDVIY